MRLLKSAFVVAALALASPVWADGGHGRGPQVLRGAPSWLGRPSPPFRMEASPPSRERFDDPSYFYSQPVLLPAMPRLRCAGAGRAHRSAEHLYPVALTSGRTEGNMKRNMETDRRWRG